MTATDHPDKEPLPADIGSASIFPCTLLQERMWAQSKDPRSSRSLNVAMHWLVQGNLSHADTETVLNILVQRHEILRTSFREIDGKVRQIVWPAVHLRVREIDVTFLAEEDRHARAEEIAKAEAREQIDPRQAPLLRATLVRLAPDQSVLLLTFHSMVADGWSIGLLVREFRTVAAGIEAGKVPAMQTPELQFADYALWEKETLSSGALDHSRAFWRRRLRDAEGTQVPPDRPRDDGVPGESRIVSTLLATDFGHQAEAFAREQGVTFYGVAAAALAVALHRATGDSDIVFGSQVANREESLAEGIIGPLVNSITLRIQVDDSIPLGMFLKSACSAVQESLEHQRLPFEAVDKGRASQLHAINFVVQRAYSDVSQEEEVSPGSFTMRALPSHSSGALWDLNFFLIHRQEGWRMSCEADMGRYEIETIDGLLASWRQCLEALVTQPGDCLDDRPPQRGVHVRVATSLEREHADPILVEEDPSRRVLRFNSEGSRAPIVALNNGKIYYPLANELGAIRPLIDIRVDHPDGPFTLPRRAFEDFAADAVRLIRWAQPRGPYILCGLCSYGVLAFEAARQLQRLGEHVALVAIFDGWAPGYRETMPIHDRLLRKLQLRFKAYLKRIRQRGSAEIVLQPILRRLGLAPPPPGPEPYPASWFDGHIAASIADYRPRPYDGDVVLFRSTDTLRGRLFDEKMGWEPLVHGQLNKLDIDSGHLDILKEPAVSEVAACLTAKLDLIEGR